MEREMRIRNYSEKSITTYLYSVQIVSGYFNLPPGRITINQVKTYLYHLIDKEHCSTSKINQIISAWKILQQDILNREWDGIRIKRPRRDKKLPVVLSRQEALKLIDTPTSLKHRAILALAYATGIRRNELLTLTFHDIDRNRKVIKVNGKGNKQREVSMPGNLLKLLVEYYKRYHPTTFLFEGFTPGVRYSSSSIANIVRRSANQAGIKKDVSPHTLRHTFATHMLESGVNLKRLQMLMGHSSIKTTSLYLHLANIDNVTLPDLTSNADGTNGK
jgi:integrase/recombinase XerD